MPKALDGAGWLIVTLHQMIGHDKTAIFIGQDPDAYDRKDCVMCQFERGKATQQDVYERLGR